MMIELSPELESVLETEAKAKGVSVAAYVRETLEHTLAPALESLATPRAPFKSGRGMWAKYGISISEEDIAENRAEMFKNFGEGF